MEEYRASGRELERTSRSVKEKMKDTGATAADDLEGAARQAASGTRVAKKKAKEK